MAHDVVNVQILKVINPGEFWAKEAPTQCMSAEAREFQELLVQIKDYAENDEMPALRVSNPSPGMLCLGKRVSQGLCTWYRVRVKLVLNTSHGPQASCFLLDFAEDGVMIPVQFLRVLPEEVLRIPFQAKKCLLHGIQPISMGMYAGDTDITMEIRPSTKWDSSARVFMNDTMENFGSPMIEVIEKDKDGSFHVRLHGSLFNQGRICINDLLVYKEYATYSDKKLKGSRSNASSDSEGTRTRKRCSNRDIQEFLNPDMTIPGLQMAIENDRAASLRSTDEDLPKYPNRSPNTAINGQYELEVSRSNASSDSEGTRTRKRCSNRDIQEFLNPDMTIPGLQMAIESDRAASLRSSDEDPPKYSNRSPNNPSPGRGLSPVSAVNGPSVGQSATQVNVKPRPMGRAHLLQQFQDACSPPVGRSSPESLRNGSPGPAVASSTPVVHQSIPDLAAPRASIRTPPGGRGKLLENVLNLNVHDSHTVVRRSSPPVGRGVRLSDVLSDLPSVGRGRGIQLGTPQSTYLQSASTSAPKPPQSQFSDFQDSDTDHISYTSASNKALSASQLTSRTPIQFDSEPFDRTEQKFHSVTEDRRGASAQLPKSPGVYNGIEEDSAASATVKHKKNVSFSDQEEFFSIPCQRLPAEDNFRATAYVQSEQLQKFAGATSCFSASTDQMQPENLTPEDYNVRVFGVRTPRFWYKTRDTTFTESVKRVLDMYSIRKCTRLQMYSWPLLSRGYNLIGVGKRNSGKTLAYLTHVLSALHQTSSYENLPKSCGPYILIVTPNIKKARGLNDFLMQFHEQDKNWRLMILFGGLDEDLEIDLLNGCEILVSTPQSLLRMLNNKVTNLKRLAHLVLDDLDILLEDSPEQVEKLMAMFHKEMNDRNDDVTAPRQLIAMASQWTNQVQAFGMTHMLDAKIIIASQLEAAFAAQVKQVALVSLNEQRVEQLISQVRGELHHLGHKMIVFVNSDADAQKIHKIMQSRSIFSLPAHDDLVDTQLDEVIRGWNLPHRDDSKPVMICTDGVVENYGHKIDDATCSIHFDAPETKSCLEKRLWCMRKNWKPPHTDQQAGDGIQCLSYWYLTDANESQAANIAKLLTRSGSTIPQQISDMIEKFEEKIERGKRNQLCEKLKAFGRCLAQRRCSMRHRIFHSLDYPGQNHRYVNVPMQGQIKIQLTHVKHASCYFARMLEVTDHHGNTTLLSEAYGELLIDMAFWYAIRSHKKQCEFPQINHLYAFEDGQHTFNRVYLLKLKDHKRGEVQKAKVLFVDTGSEIEIAATELLELPEKLEAIPYQAVEVYVCRVKPVDGEEEWTINVGCEMASKIDHQELVGNIVLSLGCTVWLDPLISRTRLDQLGIYSNEYSVRSLLLEDQKAEENNDHLNLLYELCRGRIDIPHTGNLDRCPTMAYTVQNLVAHTRTREFPVKDKYETVLLTAMDDPDLFYMQLSEDQEEIQKLQWDISDYVKHNEFECPVVYQKAMLVLAKFPSEDLWYRGKVSSVTPEENEYDIFFVDYGDSDIVKGSDILPMPGRFQNIPFYAIECCLEGLEPVGEEWPEEAGDYIYDITRKNQNSQDCKLLHAKVMKKGTARHSGRFLYAVEIYDTNNEYHINIGYQLILRHQAKLSSTHIKGLFPQLDNLPPESVAAQICQNCMRLLESEDRETLANCAKEVQRLVLTILGSKEELSGQNVVCAMCTVLRLNHEPVVLEMLINSTAYLVKQSEQLLIEMNEGKGLNALAQILDNTADGELIQSILWAFKQLMSITSCAEMLKCYGVIRILADILSQDTAGCEELLLDVLGDLLRDVRELNDLETGCLEAITEKISTSTNMKTVYSCLHVLDNLASSRINARDKIRKKGGLKAICIQMEAWTDPLVRAEAVKALRSMANNNRFNKDVMNEYRTKIHLQKYSEDKRLSEEIRDCAVELHQRLQSLMPSDKYTRSPTKNPSENSLVNGHHQTNGVQIDGIQLISANSIIKNKPLPAKFCSNTVPIKSMKPDIRWIQDKWNLLLTVHVKNVSPKEDVAQFSDDRVYFRVVLESIEYMFEFHLYEMIIPSECEVRVTLGSVHLGLRKKTRGCWPRVMRQKHNLPYLSVDADRFVDSSSEEEDTSADESKAAPLSLVTRHVQGDYALTSAKQSGGRRREYDGIPPELVVDIDSDYSEDSFEEYMQPADQNRKYDYHNPQW